jgi:hypothetical protein
MDNTVMKLINYTLYILFFPVCFVALLAVSLISGVGGVLHIIVYDLYPLFKSCLKDLRNSFNRVRPSKRI